MAAFPSPQGTLGSAASPTSPLHALLLAPLSGPHSHTQWGGDWPNSFLPRRSLLHVACTPSDIIDGMAS